MIQGTGKPLSLRLPANLLRRIDAHAKSEQTTRSEQIRTMLEEWFELEDVLEKPKPAEAGRGRCRG